MCNWTFQEPFYAWMRAETAEEAVESYIKTYFYDVGLLEYENFNKVGSQDLIFTAARNKGLRDFCVKWATMSYDDLDNNPHNMFVDYIDTLKEKGMNMFA